MTLSNKHKASVYMEKRFFVALALSFLVITVYSGMKGKQYVANEEVATQAGAPAVRPNAIQPIESGATSLDTVTSEESAVSSDASAVSSDNSAIVPGTLEERVFDEEDAQTTLFETEKLVLTISKIGGYVKSIELKEPRAHLSFHGFGAERGWTEVPFEMRRSADGFVLEYKAGTGEEITKEFSFETPLSLALTVTYKNVSDLNSDNYKILLGAVGVKDKKDPISSRYLELSYSADVVSRRALLGLKKTFRESKDLRWIGLRDKYFAQVVVPGEPGFKGIEADVVGGYRLVWASVAALNVVKARVYFGPEDEKALRAFEEGAQQIVSYGKFDLIAKPLLVLLKLLQRVTRNWGLAIILMTIIVYTILSPLSLKSMKSMRRMQALQPQVEALKAKLKDNPQKLNAEIMELYRREQVNPFGGCLPIVLQIPVFFSLYQVLMRSIELKGQGFLWIKDLSEPDRLFRLGHEMPIIGSDFNLLPILMAGLMVLQQKITTKSSVAASPEMAQQQKIMGTVMPLVFGVLFYKIQSGLVLYWFTNSLLSVIFQWKVNKTVNGKK